MARAIDEKIMAFCDAYRDLFNQIVADGTPPEKAAEQMNDVLKTSAQYLSVERQWRKDRG